MSKRLRLAVALFSALTLAATGTILTASSVNASGERFSLLGSIFEWMVPNESIGMSAGIAPAYFANPPSVVVNKYQNASTDALELLVIDNGLDMRGMIVKDFSANMVNDGGGSFIFSTNALWSSVRAGTLIILRNNNTAADTTVGGSDFVLDVGLTNTTYFTSGGGAFDIAGTEMIMIKSAGSGTAGVTGSIHALAGGTAGAQFTAAPIYKLLSSGGSGSGQFVYANNSTSSLADYDGTGATGLVTNLAFGVGNNANNTTYINALRASASAPTTQASNIAFSSVTTNSMTVSWMNGNGSKRIVKMNTSNSFTAPVDGTDPTASAAWANAGEQVVYNDTGSNVNITGLAPSTTYHFRVYEANGSASTVVFRTATATNNPNSQSTNAPPPATRLVATTGTDTGNCISAACATIAYASGQAVAGDTISIAAGTYTQSSITVNKNLTITGAGAPTTIVQANAAPNVAANGVFLVLPGVTASISGLTIRHGSGGGTYGGGIHNLGTLAVTNSTISGNAGAVTGGISNGIGALTLTNSTISGNSATDSFFGLAGGLSCENCTLTVINSTVSGNSAAATQNGAGGIYATSFANVIVTNSTITGNSAGTVGKGGVVNNNATSVTVRSSIIAANQSNATVPDLGGAFTSSGYNLIGNVGSATGFTATGDLIGTGGAGVLDPLLGALAPNGGPTSTHALLPGSPAIDNGINTLALTTDQRGLGFARLVDLPTANAADGTDIGAFEAPPEAETTVVLSGGNLTITDTNGGNSNDNITLACALPDITITDVGNGLNQTVPISSVTGSITVNTLGGNDTLTVNLSGCDFINGVAEARGEGVIVAGGLFYNGGENSGDHDVLNIVGGNQGTVTYGYGPLNGDGTVAMSNFGTITYTGLEPIVNSGTATDVIFNLPGPAVNSATLADDGVSGNGMSRLSAPTFEMTDFANPSGSVTINRGTNPDGLNIGDLPDLTSSLIVGADASRFNQIAFLGTVNLASGKNLSGFSINSINFTNSASDVSTSGAGTISLTTGSSLILAAGSSVNTVDGSLTLSANQQVTATTGSFSGINVAGTIQATGTGVVSVSGRGGTVGAGNTGVFVNGGGLIRGGNAVGVVTTDIFGTGGSGGSNPHGVDVEPSSIITSLGGNVRVRGFAGTSSTANNYGVIPVNGGIITSGGNGNVVVEGTGGQNAGGGNVGIIPHQSGSITSGGSGTVTVTGTGGNGPNSHGVQIFRDGRINSGGSGTVSVTGTAGGSGFGVFVNGLDNNSPGARINSGGGAISVTGVPVSGGLGIVLGGGGTNTISSVGNASITLISDTMTLDGTGVNSINSGTGPCTIVQMSNGKPIGLGGTDSATLLGLTDNEIDKIAAGTLNVGNSFTGGITFSGASPIDVTDVPIIPILNLTTSGTGISSNPTVGVLDVIASELRLTSSTTTSVDMDATMLVSGSTGLQTLSEANTVTLGVGGINASATGPVALTGGRFNTVATTGSITSNNLQVQNGATVGGTGIANSLVSNNIQSGATIAPGTSPGIFTVSGATTMAAGSSLAIEIGGTTAGSGHDQLTVFGSIDLGGATLSLVQFGGFTPVSGQTFTIVDKTSSGAITGTFAGLAEGAVITNFLGSGLNAKISYVGGDNNDVVLTVLVPPTVTSVNPSTGSTAGGTAVTITGTNLTGATAVTFAGNPATSVVAVNSTTITAVTPAGSAGTASVVVTTPNGTSGPNALYTYVLPPTLGVYPATSVGLSDNVTITPGAVPIDTTSISVSAPTSFNGKLTADPATGVVRVTNAALANIPPGVYLVTVRAFGPGGTSTRTFNLTVNNAPVCAGLNFTSAVNFGVGTEPSSVAIGDFNGDGNQDIASANANSNDVSILVGNGAGSFAPAVNFAVGSEPSSVAVGDFNGDGNQDIAVVNRVSFNVSILVGNGAGSFAPAVNFAVGSDPYSLAVGDFNGDGNQDLAAANYTSNNVSILVGNGAGSFAPAVNLAVGTGPVSVAIGDFSGDGNQDIVAVNRNSNNVSILVGNGAGSFAPAVNFAVGSDPFSVAVGDFNGDGNQDIAVVNRVSLNVSILVGNGAGSFAPAVNFAVGQGPLSVAVGDFNGDGNQDIATANVVSNDISILRRTCNTPPTISSDTISAREGSPVANFTIATAADGEQAPNTLGIKVNGGVSATVNGVTVSGLSIAAGGAVTANVVAACGATAATFSLGVTDAQSATGSGTLTVNVAPNTPPTLTYTATPVAYGGAVMINPATGPMDNGSVASIVLQSQGTFTGAISVNNVTGVITVSGAIQPGAHTITVRATDNCGAVTDAAFTLTVGNPPTNLVVTKTADTNDGLCSPTDCSLREAVAAANAVADANTITFNIPSNAPGCTGAACTIVLGGTEIVIGQTVTIDAAAPNVVTVSGNNASRVFGIAFGATAAINDLTVANGNGGTGAGIINSGTLGLTRVTVRNNQSTNDGGGIESFGSLTLTGSTIRNNSAPNIGGGIVAFGGTTTLINSTVSNNTASQSGGIHNQAILMLTNSTVSVNTATSNAGGVSNLGTMLTMLNTTISNNTGQGLRQNGGTNFSMVNTIIANNSAQDCFRGTGTGDATNSLIESGLGCINGTNISNLTGDPLLGPLADNGGLTMTHALLPGSIAINAGNNCVVTDTCSGITLGSNLTADQRGIARPKQGTVDIGAFESQGFAIAIASGNNQSTFVNTNFANPLAVTVTSAFGEPVNGGQVTFTPPVSGASAAVAGSPATITGGTATSGSVTANGTVGGPYNVAATANGAPTTLDFALTNLNPPPTITAAAAVTRQQGTAALNSPIATVSDPNQMAGTLTVTATAVPTGISITNIVNNFGAVTADIAAGCDAAPGANTIVLTVTDDFGATATANFTVNVTANPGPTVTWDPVNQTVTYGAAGVMFTAAANGVPAPAVQWQVQVGGVGGFSNLANAAPYSGVTTGTLTIANPSVALSTNRYRAVFTVTCGSAIAANSNSALLTVNRKTVTPSVTASNKVYDGNTSATLLTRTLTGVVGTDDVMLTGGTATFDNKNVGTGKPVTATGLTLSGTAAGNYVLSSTTAATTANITALNLTATLGAANKVYDGTTAATITSCTPVGVIAPDVVTCTGSAATFDNKNVGTAKTVTATVTLAGAGAGNYTVTSPATTTADITKAVLTVTASSDAVTYGGAVPAVTANITGFVTGEGLANLTTQPVCSTTYTQGSGVAGSPYATSCSGGSATNYSFNYVNGAVTVTKAVLTVTADDKARVYGAANPAFTATVAGFVLGQNLGTSGVTGSPSFTTNPNATATSGPGSYSIVPAIGTLASANYSFTFVMGTLAISQAATTTTITNAGSLGINSAIDQSYAVTWTTSPVAPGAGTPTGNVTVSDGTGESCSAPVASGTCQLTSTTTGVKTITASYPGDANFTGSTSQTVSHTVIITVTGNVKQFVAGGTNTNLAGVTITISGSGTTQTLTDAAGNYTFGIGAAGGSYTLTATGLGKTYDPISRNYNNVTTNITNADFIAYDQNGPNVIPRELRILNTVGTPGTPVTVPVELQSQGNETSIAFSVNFDNALLGIPTVVCGTAAAGCTATINTSIPGKAGITIVPTATMTAGARQIARITFPTAINTATSTPISFGDIPTARDIRSTQNNPLLAFYRMGSISFASNLEGDVVDAAGASAGGDGVQSNDVTILRQIVLGLITPDLSNNQFQRADVSPSSTFGDGRIDSTDVTVTRLYSLGLLPPAVASGPTGPVASRSESPEAVGRIIRAVNTNANAGQTITVSFQLDSQGDEASASFTANWNPAVLTYVSSALGTGTPTGTNLGVNTGQTAQGRLGVLLDSTNPYAAGTRQIMTVTFTVAAGAQVGTYPITFSSSPTAQSVSSAQGALLTTTYENGNVVIGATAAGVSVAGKVTTPNGLGLRNATVTITDGDGNRRTTATGSFGIYHFENIEAGRSYIIAVTSKRFRFAVRAVNVTDSLANVDFVGLE